MGAIGIILAIGIGITLGLMGSGGSILTVPVFVYVFHIEPNLATTYSLFAIALSSFVGTINNFFRGTIDFNKILLFGFPSIIVVFLTRQFILPWVPDEFVFLHYRISQNDLLMLLFALVMFLSAYRMIKKEASEKLTTDIISPLHTVLQGAMVGFVTGVVGAGGGFLIIPALINFYKMPMKIAVATSLAIICLNSIFGLLGDIEKFDQFEWTLLTSYSFLLIIGMFVGMYISKYFQGSQLKRGLGYLILIIATYILLREFVLE